MGNDETCIRRCIALAEAAFEVGDLPYGALIVKDGEVLCEAQNRRESRITDHAETLVLNKAHELLGSSDLSGCTLYSNAEPCPMCSFMIREFKISRVVFAKRSPTMGGYTRWDILQDTGLPTPFFSAPPEVVGGVLEEEASKVFERATKRYLESQKNDYP